MTGDSGTPPAMAETAPSHKLFPGILAPLLLGAYLLLGSTTTLIPALEIFDSKRILQFGLLIFLFLLPLTDRRMHSQLGLMLRTIPLWLKLILLGIAATGVVSAAVNSQSLLHFAASLSDVILLCSLAMAIPVIAACRQVAGRRFDQITLALLAMTGLAVGFQELLGVFASHAMGVEFNYHLSLLHFAHPRFFNQVQSWIIPVLVALPLVFANHRAALFACLLVLGLNWYIIFVTGARGSFVSIAAALLFCVALLPAVRRPVIRWQLAGILLGGLIYAGVLLSFEAPAAPSVAAPSTQEDRQESSVDSGGTSENSSFYQQSLGRSMLHSTGRIRAWTHVIGDVLENPVLGIGPMNYACVQTRWLAHPHNFPLQLAGEWGLPAAMAVVVVILVLFWQLFMAIRKKAFANNYDTALAGFLFAGLLAASLHSCFSGVPVMPASQATGILIGGMLAGLLPLQQHPDAKGHARTFALTGMLGCSLLLAWGIYELQTMEQREALRTNEELLMPRMWQDSRLCRFYIHPNPVTN